MLLGRVSSKQFTILSECLANNFATAYGRGDNE